MSRVLIILFLPIVVQISPFSMEDQLDDNILTDISLSDQEDNKPSEQEVEKSLNKQVAPKEKINKSGICLLDCAPCIIL